MWRTGSALSIGECQIKMSHTWSRTVSILIGNWNATFLIVFKDILSNVIATKDKMCWLYSALHTFAVPVKVAGLCFQFLPYFLIFVLKNLLLSWWIYTTKWTKNRILYFCLPIILLTSINICHMQVHCWVNMSMTFCYWLWCLHYYNKLLNSLLRSGNFRLIKILNLHLWKEHSICFCAFNYQDTNLLALRTFKAYLVVSISQDHLLKNTWYWNRKWHIQ